MQVPLERVPEQVRQNQRAVLVTYRKDGGLQTSPVRITDDPQGAIILTSNEGRAKPTNIARDPRVTLCVVTSKWSGGGWMSIDGRAELVHLPEAMPLLEEFYRRSEFHEHPNWDEYRQTMEAQRRVLIRITPTRAAVP
ncbi:MAG TPA: TIGR03618 family F420-dependent PPOX class oxidoreductase [Chloroflexota bacterium]|nr:TIGR03618 family F420-dependent PPOX class oxidoreductase [Chloroflexota bacterium]